MRRRARKWRELCSVRPISIPELRSPWPAVGKRELWEHPSRGTKLWERDCRSPDMCFQVNRHIGLLFGERLDTLFTSSDSKISGFTRPHVIGFVADLFFSTLESGFIFFRIRSRICRIRLDGSRIRKKKVADSKTSGHVRTGPQFTVVFNPALPAHHTYIRFLTCIFFVTSGNLVFLVSTFKQGKKKRPPSYQGTSSSRILCTSKSVSFSLNSNLFSANLKQEHRIYDSILQYQKLKLATVSYKNSLLAAGFFYLRVTRTSFQSSRTKMALAV